MEIKTLLHSLPALAVLIFSLAPAGCAIVEDDEDPPTLEIAGTYGDDFGGTHEITQTTWTTSGYGTSIFHIAVYDNNRDFLAAQNDGGNEWSPGLFSRFDWNSVQNVLYFCQTVFSAETLAEAEAADITDRSDPANGGCGGFPWSKLSPQ